MSKFSRSVRTSAALRRWRSRSPVIFLLPRERRFVTSFYLSNRLKSGLFGALFCLLLLTVIPWSYANDAVIYINSTVDAPSDPGPIIITFSGLISNNYSDWPYCGYSTDLSGIRVYNFNGPTVTGGPVYWQSLGCHCGDGLNYSASGGSADGVWYATGSGFVDYNNGTINVLITRIPPLS